MLVELPMTDIDGNGLPDIVQLNKAVNLSATGNLYIDWPFQTIDSFTLNMARGSNQLSGSYSVFRNSEAQTSSGTVKLFNMAGSATYTRSTALINFSFAMTDPLASTRTVTGSATYSVPDANHLVLPQFSVSASGVSYTFVSGFTLTRSGTRYTGNARLNDGIPETSWADATNWVIEITDTNDWDGNGVPDVSDTIPSPPYFAAQPQSQTAVVSSNATFSVSAGGSQPLRYQWQFRGTNMTGRTASTMTLTNVQLPNAGDYRVVVSNGGGAITSQVATLTVIFPPNITDQPISTSVPAGTQAQFNVAATGTQPLYYQWRHENTNVPGGTDAILSIHSAQASNSGAYSVLVSNVAGSVTSIIAYLTILTPPTINTQPQGQSVKSNANVVFSVAPGGSAPFTYRWMRNGTNVPGGTGVNLNLANVQPASEGVFKVLVSNGAGNVLSSNAILYVGRPLTLTNFVRDASGTVGVDLIGLPGTNYVLEGSLNLSNWVGVVTNSAPRGILHFSDPSATSQRFYRAKVKSP